MSALDEGALFRSGLVTGLPSGEFDDPCFWITHVGTRNSFHTRSNHEASLSMPSSALVDQPERLTVGRPIPTGHAKGRKTATETRAREFMIYLPRYKSIIAIQICKH